MSKRMIIFVGIIMGMVLAAVSYAYAQEKSPASETETLEGSISAVDWVNATITVKWLNDTGDIEFEEKTFSVPPDLEIPKMGDTIGVADLEIGDQVTVEYYKDPAMGTLKATGILVKAQ